VCYQAPNRITVFPKMGLVMISCVLIICHTFSVYVTKTVLSVVAATKRILKPLRMSDLSDFREKLS